MVHTPSLQRAACVSRRLNIAIDLNGVIRHDAPRKRKTLSTHLEKKGRPVSLRKTTPVSRALAKTHGLSPKEYRAIMDPIYIGPEALTVRAYPMAQRYLSLLLREQHKVTVVTSASDPAVVQAIAWLEQKGIKIPVVGVGEGNRDKSEFVQGFDVAVDDELIKLDFLRGVVPHRILFMPSWPAENLLPDDSVMLVQGWGEMYRLIRQLACYS